MSFIKKALCAAAVGGLALSAPAMAAPKSPAKSVSKLATKDVRAGTKVKKAQGADAGSILPIVLIGGAAVVVGVVAATSSSS